MKTEWIDNNQQCTMNNVQWRKVKLGEVCEDIFSGRNTKRNDFGKYVVFGSTGLIGYSDTYEYDFDAILVARVGANAGLVNIASGLYDVSDNTLIIKLGETIILDYLYFLLIQINLNQYIFGSGQPLVTAGLLKNLEISIPSLPVQRRIAAILSSADKVIASTQKVIDKLKQIKQGMMDDLLKPKDGWRMVKLGECCERITDGSHDSPKSEINGYYMPSVKDMTYNSFDFTNCKKISTSDYLRLKNMGCKPEVGDVLIAKDGSILKYCFVMKEDIPIVVLSSIAILKPNVNIIESQYLAYFFQK